ncbi:MAG: TM2 domain-containing protein [Bacteroidales bacterium]|nr:TM2 domain-containing protein [Bacteroidales bacterium]
MNRTLRYIPEAKGNEMYFLDQLLKEKDDQYVETFSNVYRARRRDPQLILLTTLLGFVLIAGIQRFLTNNIGLGILYVFTAGLCFIGTIVDAVNYENIAFDYNRRIAEEVSNMITR